MHLYEKPLASKIIHTGKIITVTEDLVELENGRQAIRDMVHHNGGVCVLPVTEDKQVILVKQFRYPFSSVLLEAPAGKIDKDEDPFECGKRELKEETGAIAEKYTSLGVMYPTAAYDTEKIYLYMAQGLSFDKQKLDADEFIDVVKMPFDEALDLVMKNELPDAKTQIAILKASQLIK